MQKLLITSSILLAFFSCVEPNEPVGRCHSGTMCTEEFRTISVKIVDNAGKSVALDRFRTLRLPDSLDITRQLTGQSVSSYYEKGIYPVADDGLQNKIPEFVPTSIVFEGFIGSQKVASEEYSIIFDCCHIQKQSGPETIVSN